MKARCGAAVAAIAMLTTALSACAAGGPGPTSVACVSWVDMSDPQFAYDEADAVIIGTPQPTGDTKEMFGVDAAVHDLAVDEVIKGELDADTVRVASTPVTCSGDEIYPEGDPLLTDSPVIVFLRAPQGGGGTWILITPFDTVLPMPADGSLPFVPDDTQSG